MAVLRRQRWTGKQIAQAVGVSPATVSRVLKRLGISRLRLLGRLVRGAESGGHCRARHDGGQGAGKLATRFRENRERMTGGLGSGRPAGSASDTVAACGSIDVNRLCPQGCLRASSECEGCSQVIYWPPLIPAGES